MPAKGENRAAPPCARESVRCAGVRASLSHIRKERDVNAPSPKFILPAGQVAVRVEIPGSNKVYAPGRAPPRPARAVPRGGTCTPVSRRAAGDDLRPQRPLHRPARARSTSSEGLATPARGLGHVRVATWRTRARPRASAPRTTGAPPADYLMPPSFPKAAASGGRPVLRAKAGRLRHADGVRPPRPRSRPEMEFVALRENLRRETIRRRWSRDGEDFGAEHAAGRRHARSSCATRWPAAAP